MKLNKKSYNISKIKNYLKFNSLFFFCQGSSKNSKKWLYIEQEIKALGYNSYKVLNKPTSNALQNSIFINSKPLLNGLNFIIKPLKKSSRLTKNMFKKKFEPLLFLLTAIKINNKIYSVTQLKKLYVLNYKENKLLFYQFAITQLKSIKVTSK